MCYLSFGTNNYCFPFLITYIAICSPIFLLQIVIPQANIFCLRYTILMYHIIIFCQCYFYHFIFIIYNDIMCISCLLYLFMLLILYLLRYYNLYIYHHVRLRSNVFITGSQFSLTALNSHDSIYNSKVLLQQTQLLPLTLILLSFFSSFLVLNFCFFFLLLFSFWFYHYSLSNSISKSNLSPD